jgi:hypothetical protein
MDRLDYEFCQPLVVCDYRSFKWLDPINCGFNREIILKEPQVQWLE